VRSRGEFLGFLLLLGACLPFGSGLAQAVLAQAGDPVQSEAELRAAMERSPEDATYAAKLGALLATKNRQEEASALFEKALRLNPGDQETRRNLAASHWRLGRLAEARENLQTVLKVHPEDSLAIFLLGLVSEDIGDHRGAANLLESVPQIVRQRPASVSALARANYHLGEREKAREALLDLLYHLDDLQGLFQAARTAAEFSDYDTALKLFTALRPSYPDHGILEYNIALSEFSVGRFTDCEKTLRAVIATGVPTADMCDLLGWCYQRQGKHLEAVRSFQRAIGLDSSRDTLFLDLAEVLSEDKDYQGALEIVGRVLKVFPPSARAYELVGSVKMRQAEPKAAVESYLKAQKIAPADPEASLGVAVAQWAANETEQAGNSFEQGTTRFPGDAMFHLQYAEFLLDLAEAGDRTAEPRAGEHLQACLKLEPSDPEAHYYLGRLLLQQGKYGDAVGELKVAENLRPQMAKIHYALGRAYQKLGRLEEAAKENEKFRYLKEREEPEDSISTPSGKPHG
jgi:tetratricopeptide (TPR) repeat protein